MNGCSVQVEVEARSGYMIVEFFFCVWKGRERRVERCRKEKRSSESSGRCLVSGERKWLVEK